MVKSSKQGAKIKTAPKAVKKVAGKKADTKSSASKKAAQGKESKVEVIKKSPLKEARTKETPKKSKKIETQEAVVARADDEVGSEVEIAEVEEIGKSAGKKGKAAKAKKNLVPIKIDPAEAEKRWLEIQSKMSGEPTVDYKMTSNYDPNTCIRHKVLGWGYILSVQNDRLEVLFQSGIKTLISNFKGSV